MVEGEAKKKRQNIKLSFISFHLQKAMMERKTVLLNNGVSRCLTHDSVTANDEN